MARRTEHQLRQHVEGVNAYLQEFQREMGMPEEKWITIGLSAYSGGWSIVVMQDGAQLTTAYHDKLTYIDCTCVEKRADYLTEMTAAAFFFGHFDFHNSHPIWVLESMPSFFRASFLGTPLLSQPWRV